MVEPKQAATQLLFVWRYDQKFCENTRIQRKLFIIFYKIIFSVITTKLPAPFLQRHQFYSRPIDSLGPLSVSDSIRFSSIFLVRTCAAIFFAFVDLTRMTFDRWWFNTPNRRHSHSFWCFYVRASSNSEQNRCDCGRWFCLSLNQTNFSRKIFIFSRLIFTFPLQHTLSPF